MTALDGKSTATAPLRPRRIAIASQLNHYQKRNQLMSNLSIFTFERQQVGFVGTAEKPEWSMCITLRI